MKKYLTVVLFIISFAVAAKQDFGSVTLQINEIKLTVEYAWSFKQRAQGLMHRESLCQHCGMYFRFSSMQTASMWMKNTHIPLDVAFADNNGVITDIKPLQPHDLTSVRSSRPVLYALEMNQGWFAANGIQVGDIIRLTEKPKH